jgi:hypothetical protein
MGAVHLKFSDIELEGETLKILRCEEWIDGQNLILDSDLARPFSAPRPAFSAPPAALLKGSD